MTLNSFGLTKKVTFPIHHLLNTLDLTNCLKKKTSKSITSDKDLFFSDHHMVHFNLINKIAFTNQGKVNLQKT